jgi:hypothetical protein
MLIEAELSRFALADLIPQRRVMSDSVHCHLSRTWL